MLYHDSEPPELQYDDAVEDALGGEPRAQELRRMRDLLARRRASLAEELNEAEPAQREKLRKKLVELDEQIEVLREEASITEFVEDAVRVGVEMRRLQN